MGMKGSRIHGIVRELKNENIDVINWTNNIQLLIQRSLTPSKITSMDIDSEKLHANVFLKPDQVSLAIGRKGVNIKLAQELTGYSIDVFRDNEGETEEFDIDLLLQALYLQADGGLRATDAVGRARERARLVDGDERLQQVQVEDGLAHGRDA